MSFTADAIKMTLGQWIYQVAIILIFDFLGHTIFGLDRSGEGDKVAMTLVLNTFVFPRSSTRSTARGSTTSSTYSRPAFVYISPVTAHVASMDRFL